MRIGITGHRRLSPPASWAWVERAIETALGSLAPPLVAVTSLAAGADQLFTRLVAKRGGSIHAVIPFAGYERTMIGDELPRYEELLRAAATVEILAVPGSDEDAYLAAGRRVVDLADELIAVWDGMPAKGKGGTGDIVVYAIHSRVPVIHINPIDQSTSTR